MTTTVLSRCVYLSQKLLAKKLVKVNKNCRKFEMKYFKAIHTTSDLLIIAFYTHNSLLYQTTLLSFLCFFESSSNFQAFPSYKNRLNKLTVLNFWHHSIKFSNCIHYHCLVQTDIPIHSNTMSLCNHKVAI